jgi:hypothetical protein
MFDSASNLNVKKRDVSDAARTIFGIFHYLNALRVPPEQRSVAHPDMTSTDDVLLAKQGDEQSQSTEIQGRGGMDGSRYGYILPLARDVKTRDAHDDHLLAEQKH